MEQKLAAGRSEWQVAELVNDDEVYLGQMLGDPTLSSVAGLDLQTIDEVDQVVEGAARARPDAASGDCDSHMCFAGTATADQDGVTLPGEEAAAGKIIDRHLV